MRKKLLEKISKLWPNFFSADHSIHLQSFYTFSNYPRIWFFCISILVIASLAPLILSASVHYRLIHKSVNSELILRAERLTSNAKRSVTFFIDERLDALSFTVNEIGYETLVVPEKLQEIFSNLKIGFGGFSDLSVINQNGRQVTYAGPFNLKGKDYKNQPWFTQSLKSANYISEVFTGHRDTPHIIITVRSTTPDGAYFLLRATLDIERLMKTLLSYKTGLHTDVFLMNHEGVLQTPSSKFGNLLTRTPLPIPKFSYRTTVQRCPADTGQKTVITGYSYISTDLVDTPFILMVRKEKEGVMRTWLDFGKKFNWIIGIGGGIMLIIIILLSTFLVNKLYLADKTKADTMLHMEQHQQLASIGQLAAGVAHEINNPLALINETVGYIKDVYTFSDEEIDREEILENIDAVLEAVKRCGTITTQLLGFVREFDVKIKKVDLGKMIKNVLTFHKKEAEYRNIAVQTTFPDLPVVLETDSGKLQQVFVNLVNNAFQALENDGCLNVIITLISSYSVEISISDTGCGIPEENLEKIHEPFFSTKKEDEKGTGLGLSITYGLVKKLKGHITVESTEGLGTTFTILLPLKIQREDLA